LAEDSFGGEHGDDYITEMQAFLESIRGETPPACDGQEALAVLAQVIRVRDLAGLPAGA